MYYPLRLLSVNPTNPSPTITQPRITSRSLKTVNANTLKHLQNGFPNGHPFAIPIGYDIYGAFCTGLTLSNPLNPPAPYYPQTCQHRDDRFLSTAVDDDIADKRGNPLNSQSRQMAL